MKRGVCCVLLICLRVPTARAERVCASMIHDGHPRPDAGQTVPTTITASSFSQIYEGLIAWRSDGTVAPMLAKGIDASADGRDTTPLRSARRDLPQWHP